MFGLGADNGFTVPAGPGAIARRDRTGRTAREAWTAQSLSGLCIGCREVGQNACGRAAPPGARRGCHHWRDATEVLAGKRAAETVPLEFLKRADDIEIVDAPAQAKFSRLREMALLAAAEVVEAELRDYLHTHRIEEIWGTQERILVGITPRSGARPLLESGRRNADRFHGELFVAYVRQPELSSKDEASLEKNLAIARELRATIEVLQGHRDPVRALITFARKTGITQIFIGHSLRRGWWHRLRGNPVERLIDL